MKLTVNGNQVHVSSGGREHVEGRPWIVLLHGAGFSHLSFVLQTRALAYDGFNVLAPDFPGHNLSPGKPLASVAELAQWALQLMEAAGCGKAVVAGHSMGALAALEVARLAPQRVRALIIMAAGAAIPVNPALLDMAANKQRKAIESMVSWAHGAQAHVHENTWPGASHLGFSVEMMLLNAAGALHTDLQACAQYSDGLETAAKLGCPSLCLFARADRMTPLQGGLQLAAALGDNETVIVENSGHSLPSERPRQVNAAIRSFLSRRAG